MILNYLKPPEKLSRQLLLCEKCHVHVLEPDEGEGADMADVGWRTFQRDLKQSTKSSEDFPIFFKCCKISNLKTQNWNIFHPTSWTDLKSNFKNFLNEDLARFKVVNILALKFSSIIILFLKMYNFYITQPQQRKQKNRSPTNS